MKTPSDHRQRILDAAVLEINQHGPAGLRIKRVAAAAGTSAHGIYFYFRDREGLVAAALAYRMTDRMADYVRAPSGLLDHATTKAEVLDILSPFLYDTTSDDRQRLREEIVTAAAASLHNEELAEKFRPRRDEAYQRMLQLGDVLAERHLLADGVTAPLWSRFWLSVLFGQVLWDTSPVAPVSKDEWSQFLVAAAATMLQDAPLSQLTPN